MCFPVNIAKFLRTSILKNVCERLLLFIAEIGSRGYHVYKDSSWKPIHVNQPIVQLEKNSQLLQMDPYPSAIIITRPDKIGSVTVWEYSSWDF